MIPDFQVPLNCQKLIIVLIHWQNQLQHLSVRAILVSKFFCLLFLPNSLKNIKLIFFLKKTNPNRKILIKW